MKMLGYVSLDKLAYTIDELVREVLDVPKYKHAKGVFREKIEQFLKKRYPGYDDFEMPDYVIPNKESVIPCATFSKNGEAYIVYYDLLNDVFAVDLKRGINDVVYEFVYPYYDVAV